MSISEHEAFLVEATDQDKLDFSDIKVERSAPLYFPTPMDEEMMRNLRDQQLMAGIEGSD